MQLQKEFPEWSLAIAGPDLEGFRDELVKKFPAAFPSPSIHWIGNVSGDRKQALLHEASFFVLPSYSENFGHAIAEALAHATPVLTTDRTPRTDLDRRGCGWVIQPDERQLTTALQNAFQTPPVTLEAMGRQGKAWISYSFTWEQITRSMIQAYTHLLEQGPKPDFLLDP